MSGLISKFCSHGRLKSTILGVKQKFVVSTPAFCRTLSRSSILAICSGWKVLEVLDLGECQMFLLLHAHRSCIMLTNYLAWYWLDICIWDACVNIMDKQAHFPDNGGGLFYLSMMLKKPTYCLKSPQCPFSSSSQYFTLPHMFRWTKH